ncbi:unnamed protein product [Adineta ricciae]|uniref:PLAT domain-containing protein n=1 Tax=Adineta ricciae TaxID=249248 RepID=A0A815QC25_ADIRI|nr:unnamed protein product [Adineta ricciae]
MSSKVAGNGNVGSQPSQLNSSNGIYVDNDMTVYVADNNNHRIQILNNLSVVVLDINGYLYIADSNNNRAIVGCAGNYGTSASQLNYPVDLQFDSYGSLYICDNGNNRIQKFAILYNPVSTFTSSIRWLYSPACKGTLELRPSEDCETNPYTLVDDKRKILQRGSIDSFIFSVPKSLGLLNYLRIWHHNSGLHSSPSWFLK